ncbi:TRAP transporter small permease [Chachezhania antarctica]|mgnify:CR=1 FL=1|uniref:TRAP transporter small permease n=1 Tax=Chachezhania antarctica TaxID=2340860 RepID=UPI000EB5164F|nr:TRAP transporter small permease [Chachezhania antarctica]|tara:strand:- start:251 stop:808 length:558 start_codon:yes stop_codon:yes gene_type:complete
MRLIGVILNRLANGFALIGAACVVLMMVQVTADVLLKNLFTLRIPFTQALVTNWYMVAVAFMPLGLTEILDRHISVEVLYQTLGAGVRRVLGGAVCLFAALIAGIITVPLWDEAMKKLHAGAFVTENGQDISIWGGYFFPPVGFALLVVILLYRVVVLWTPLQSGMGEVPVDRIDDVRDAMREGV